MNKKLAISGAVAAIFVAFAGVSWACTPSRQIVLSPTFGPSEAQRTATVTGKGFVSGTPVEIRWNTVKGPVLGEATAPDFSVSINIPTDATPDIYYVVAVQRESGRKVISKATTVLDIPKSDSQSQQKGAGSLGDLWSGFSSTNQTGSLDLAEGEVGPDLSPAQQAAGMTLVAVAVVGMFGAVAVTMGRRGKQRSGSANEDGRELQHRKHRFWADSGSRSRG